MRLTMIVYLKKIEYNYMEFLGKLGFLKRTLRKCVPNEKK
jgi:hypothetical protein